MSIKIGDTVEFELSVIAPRNRPRWEHNRDAGGCGKWTTGVVKEVTAYNIVVHYTIQGLIGTGVCEWPYLLNPDYNPDQWKRPGFLKKIVPPKCECGGLAARTTHSHWCPVYKSEPVGRR